MGLSIFTVNDVVFTFTSGVGTQTGSNDACSLRQITWSINEKNGVSAGMEMTRKYRIGTLPSRFSDKNLTTLQRVPDTSMHIKIIYISVHWQHSKLWGTWRGVLDYIEIIWQKQEQNGDNWPSTSNTHESNIKTCTDSGYMLIYC